MEKTSKVCKRPIRKILADMENIKDMCSSELMKMTSVLDAIFWIKSALDYVKPSTIVYVSRNVILILTPVRMLTYQLRVTLMMRFL